MGRKIFISYKYGDDTVQGAGKTVRDYVDYLQSILGDDHINKGEQDDTDLSALSDETITQKLADRIYDSSVTIVMISPGMKEPHKKERDQWIPWEVSYSLKVQNRQKGGKSYPNAMIAVVLPDNYGSYEYYITARGCCRTLQTGTLFKILGENMFNRKQDLGEKCSTCGRYISTGNPSYITSVKWEDFCRNINQHINHATEISDNIDDYNLVKQLENQ